MKLKTVRVLDEDCEIVKAAVIHEREDGCFWAKPIDPKHFARDMSAKINQDFMLAWFILGPADKTWEPCGDLFDTELELRKSTQQQLIAFLNERNGVRFIRGVAEDLPNMSHAELDLLKGLMAISDAQTKLMADRA